MIGQTDEPTDNSRAYQKSEYDSISVNPPEHLKSERKSLALVVCMLFEETCFFDLSRSSEVKGHGWISNKN